MNKLLVISAFASILDAVEDYEFHNISVLHGSLGVINFASRLLVF